MCLAFSISHKMPFTSFCSFPWSWQRWCHLFPQAGWSQASRSSCPPPGAGHCQLPILNSGDSQHRDLQEHLEIMQLLPAQVLLGWESRKDCRKNRFCLLLWKAASVTRLVRKFGLVRSWVSFHNFSSFWHKYFIKTRVEIPG